MDGDVKNSWWACRRFDASDLGPMTRAVLLSVACRGLSLGEGRWLWVDTDDALARGARIARTMLDGLMDHLASLGVLVHTEVAGSAVKVFDFNAIGAAR